MLFALLTHDKPRFSVPEVCWRASFISGVYIDKVCC